MRITWLALAVALAVPARADLKTEVIPLHRIQARDAQRALADSILTHRGDTRSGVLRFGGASSTGPGSSEKRGTVLDGIVALGVHPTENALVVTGDEKAIGTVRQLVDILELQQRRFLLRVHVLAPGTVALNDVALTDLYREERDGQVVALGKQAHLGPQQMAQLLAAHAHDVQVSLAQPVGTASPLWLSLPGDAARGIKGVTLNANGDGTVTFALDFGETGTGSLQRIAPGQTAVVVTKAGAVLLLTPEMVQ